MPAHARGGRRGRFVSDQFGRTFADENNLYSQMIGSADRAEQAVQRMDVSIARMEGLERRIDAAYNALDQAINSETQHWSRWTYFTVGVLAGIIGGLVV